MRTFWIVLAILALVGVAMSLSTFKPAPTLTLEAPPKPAPKGEPDAAAAQPSPAAPAVPEASTEPVPAAKDQPAASTAPSASPAPVADKPAPSSATPAPVAPAPNVPASTPVPSSALNEARPADAQAPIPATAPAPAAPAASVATTGTKVGGYDVAAGKIETREDGSMLLDGKFVVKGDGSKDKPYEITWELLTSVDQDFDPHAGKKLLPQRIAMLHDKYVKLGGYVAFPMNMQQPKELLLMLNQWDGCCIGVPPTPYDAIEVGLDKTVTGEDRFATTGGVVGKMGIKPYVVGDWLVGLYVMDGGDYSAKFAGTGDN